MKADYNIMRPSADDLDRIGRELIEAQDKYVEKGYTLPVSALQLIRDMYKDQYAREVSRAENKGVDLPWICEDRLHMLEGLTCLKLLNSAMKTFDENPSGEFSLNFIGGQPSRSDTAEFFNLTDASGEYINIERTGELRLPDSFYHGEKYPDIMMFKISTEGEHIVMCQNGIKEEVLPDNLGPSAKLDMTNTDTPEQ